MGNDRGGEGGSGDRIMVLHHRPLVGGGVDLWVMTEAVRAGLGTGHGLPPPSVGRMWRESEGIQPLHQPSTQRQVC